MLFLFCLKKKKVRKELTETSRQTCAWDWFLQTCSHHRRHQGCREDSPGTGGGGGQERRGPVSMHLCALGRGEESSQSCFCKGRCKESRASTSHAGFVFLTAGISSPDSWLNNSERQRSWRLSQRSLFGFYQARSKCIKNTLDKGDFPGGPKVKTSPSSVRLYRFNPWSGS